MNKIANKKEPIIFLGSSRSDGDTRKAIEQVFNGKQSVLYDLNDYNISYFDYQYNNQDDDFINLAKQMMEHETIVLATPVYWYTMSAVMKTFIDRWSDLLTIRKDLGRKLRGKNLFIISTYAVNSSDVFEDIFSLTAEYLGMNYLGCFYYRQNSNVIDASETKLEIECAQNILFDHNVEKLEVNYAW
ncbi:flavodoxin family protein [Piscirickettsia litoralis]|uniref:NADPH-dependent FMN reductase-like domain-containing protein n=1 Tax=Piscirickettsia litoralis TaxID=1891921 RepID=A0ABX3A2S5_9GAMM|nr:flavodoxin family protein [Piscirickettsia litoralis]ODN43171.1 hypothetical protein BGC07_09895 [Piscirickettsia litoralis]